MPSSDIFNKIYQLNVAMAIDWDMQVLRIVGCFQIQVSQ